MGMKWRLLFLRLGLMLSSELSTHSAYEREMSLIWYAIRLMMKLIELEF